MGVDGGGIRGTSELLILKEIMERIQFQLNLEVLPLPCEYFDLIGGTSTGGLVASSKELYYLLPSCFQGLSL
jgi:patatin-like phospholipase/acyl hydrolase